MLPPGFARLSTKPPLTGSPTFANTIGTLRVACCNAATAGVAVAKVTSGDDATNSAAAFCRLPLPHRYSICRLRPSVQPNFCNASRNAVMRACASGLSLASGISTPIRRICPDCCARAASGHAAAEPPTRAMKSRRLMERPLRTDDCSLSHCPALEAMLCGSDVGAKCPLWVTSRHSRRFARCPVFLRTRTSAEGIGMSLRAKSGHSLFHSSTLTTPQPSLILRGLVFRHCNHGAGERAVGPSQLIQNREMIGIGDRYQVARDMPLRPVDMVVPAARDHGRQLGGAVGDTQRLADDRPPHGRELLDFLLAQPHLVVDMRGVAQRTEIEDARDRQPRHHLGMIKNE